MELGKDPSEVPPSITVLIHMIARIGEDNIRKIALENKPMLSYMGDPRTKGFHNGKFQEANLEALLSLDDKFCTLPTFARHEASRVSLFYIQNFVCSSNVHIYSFLWAPWVTYN
jgi:hypothetical protein